MLCRILPFSFAKDIEAFATALRANSGKTFVFVGGSAATFGYGPGYDASVTFVLTVLADEGIPSNNAPETHGMSLASDGLHFLVDNIPCLVEMWAVALRKAANRSSRFLVIESLQFEL